MPCYTLVGSELSLFTGKIKTYLQWKGIPHDVLLPSDEVFKKIIIPGAGIAMIPVLLVHDDKASLANAKVLQDTKEIMDYFETMYPPGSSPDLVPSPMQHAVVPSTPKRAFAAQLFELLADEWLLTQAMYWRWYAPHLDKQRKFLAMEFGNSSTGGLAPLETQRAIGEKRMARFAGFTPGLGVSETTSPALEWQCHELLKLMESHFDQYPFVLGDEISLADFALWGSFGPHLGRDPVPSFIIKTQAPGVWEWIERVNSGHRWAGQHVRNGNGAQNSYGTRKMQAQDPDVDDVPDSTFKIMRFLMTDYGPILQATVDRTIQYTEKERWRSSSTTASAGRRRLYGARAAGFCEEEPTSPNPCNLGVRSYRRSISFQRAGTDVFARVVGIWMWQRLCEDVRQRNRSLGEEREAR